MSFTIKGSEFLLHGQPFKIISGAVHYFRSPAADWEHVLYNLKAMGCNTVETYIPWNMHEREEGTFNFNDDLDIACFVRIAASLGLLVILRPSPYICAEWEFGGLPAWLLNDRLMRVRSADSRFMAKVATYYEALFAHISPLQITQGGNVIMMQLENEYGSFSNDKRYLQALLTLMRNCGCEVPIFTSDGASVATQRAGNLASLGVLPTGNFGSNARAHFKVLQDFYGNKFPLMCMEFWDGWFNRYGEQIIRREVDELACAVHEALTIGSVNLYMFHGGTNFGFMNGSSMRKQHVLPQVTSYDYDAILSESGNPTPKYFALQRVIKAVCPHSLQMSPRVKKTTAGSSRLVAKVAYMAVKDQVSRLSTHDEPQTMEAIDAPYGYILYECPYVKDKPEETFRVVDAGDRMHFFFNGQLKVIRYQAEIDEPIVVAIEAAHNTIAILVENMGRVNYGAHLLGEIQRKGIRTGVMSDLHFMTGNWRHYALLDEALAQADFTKPWQPGVPALYKYEINMNTPADSFIDMSGFGKGFVVVNGKNIGRFWERGPYLSLYVPHAFLRAGLNEVIVFETEGRFMDVLHFRHEPVYAARESLAEPIKK
jgi:beta-galactosidase